MTPFLPEQPPSGSGTPRTVESATTQHVNRALRGDRESLEWVVTHFTPLLKAQAAWRLGPALRGRCAPEDVVAEAWLVALPKLGDLAQSEARSTPRLLGFLGNTIVNIANRRIEECLRRRGAAAPRSAGTDPDESLREIADTVTGAITHAARNEMAAILESTLEQLPSNDREVIFLRVVEGLSNQEAAQRVREAPNTVSQRYRRALARLRNALPDSFLDDFEPE
jgi:RNA polymerase sigma-70 factor (ECF subfamily)